MARLPWISGQILSPNVRQRPTPKWWNQNVGVEGKLPCDARRGTCLRALFAPALLLLAVLAPPSMATETPKVVLRLGGEPSPIFRWSSDACEGWDVPDTAARAFRTAKGTVRLFASHHTNRSMTGPDLDSLKHDCAVAYQGAGADDPSRFDDKAWLSGFYTLDGTNVFALVHNEFQGNLRPDLCPSRQYMRCWRNSITFAVSRDGGQFFKAPSPPAHLIATPPRRYEPDLGRHVGYFNPTNIIERNGFYYAFFSAAAYGAQKYGVCVMRTDRLDDPASWRAWDGSGFTVRFVDPYRATVDDRADHTCEPIGQGRLLTPLAGVVRHAPSGLYLMTMAGGHRSAPGHPPVEGFYASTSVDLIKWTEPTLVWATPVWPRAGECGPLMNYPSLLDPRSPSRNFETVGDTPYLYYVEHVQNGCRTGQERNLLRRPVLLLGPEPDQTLAPSR